MKPIRDSALATWLPPSSIRCGLPHEGDHRVRAGGFGEEHLGVAGGHDLAAVLGREFADECVDLPLAENLQVGVRLVQEQDRAGVRVQVGEDEQGLLEAPPGRWTRGRARCPVPGSAS